MRTLGGVVDDIGQITHGEAVLPLAKPIVLFLHAMPAGPKIMAGSMVVTGMAQGALSVEIGADKVARVVAKPADLVLVPNAKVDPKLLKPAAAVTLPARWTWKNTRRRPQSGRVAGSMSNTNVMDEIVQCE